MNLDGRINDLALLGKKLLQSVENNDELIAKAIAENPWFTREGIQQAARAVSEEYLNHAKLIEWAKDEGIVDPSKCFRVGIVMAGNIPMVGFHDLLSVLISGHIAVVKMSERDSVLINELVKLLIGINNDWREKIVFTEKLKDFDAVIATGSDSASDYFEKYFSAYPHIIRRNRHGIAVIHKDDSTGSMDGLADDIFKYFGLGCRNISKLYLEEGVEPQSIFSHLEGYEDVIYHHKYKNNYDYNYALFLLNKDTFFTNNFLLLKKHRNISSRIASIHYEHFSSKGELENEIKEYRDQIQCIMSSKPIGDNKVYPFGYAQKPGLSDYADGVNTIQFLKTMHEES